MAMDIGEAEVAAAVAEGELLVVETHQVENGGVQIMDMDLLVNGGEAEFVGGAVGQATLDAAAGHPDAEAVMVVVASIASLGGGSSAKFTSPEYQGVFEQTALLQVHEQGGDRLITIFRLGAVAFFQIAMVVPGLAIAVVNLNHAHTAFHQSAGGEAGASEVAGAVQVLDRLRLAMRIEGFLGLGLHAIGHLERLDAGVELVVTIPAIAMEAVERVEQIELLPLGGRREIAIFDMVDGPLGIETGDMAPLVNARQEAIAPELGSHNGFAGTENHEAREVLVDRPEAVAKPGTHAGTNRLAVATGHHEQRWFMVGDIGVHGADDADVIDAPGDIGIEFADFDAALAVFLKLERRLVEAAGAPFGAEVRLRWFLAVVLLKRRLGIKGIDLRRAAIHEEMDDSLGPCGEMTWARSQWITGGGGVFIRPSWFRQQTGQSQHTHSGSHVLQKVSSR